MFKFCWHPINTTCTPSPTNCLQCGTCTTKNIFKTRPSQNSYSLHILYVYGFSQGRGCYTGGGVNGVTLSWMWAHQVERSSFHIVNMIRTTHPPGPVLKNASWIGWSYGCAPTHHPKHTSLSPFPFLFMFPVELARLLWQIYNSGVKVFRQQQINLTPPPPPNSYTWVGVLCCPTNPNPAPTDKRACTLTFFSVWGFKNRNSVSTSACIYVFEDVGHL